MGWLDKAFSLPTVNAAQDVAVNYAVAPVNVLVNESFTAVQSTFGGVGNFNSLNVGAPSFAQLGADYSLGDLSASSTYFGMASSLTTGVSTASATATQIKEQAGDGSTALNDRHKVQLVSLVDGLSVTFDVMPEVSEARSTEYESLQAAQMPGEFQKFKGTKATTWQVNATLTCRTRNEADLNFTYMRTMRGWTMPYFGANQGRLTGAPPPVLQFSGWRGLVGKVPVVLTSLNWTWPKDCDWIPTWSTGDGGIVPFPTVMNVQFTLVESFSASQFNQFDLEAFMAGNMVGAYGTQVVVQTDSVAEAETAAPQPTTADLSDADFFGLTDLRSSTAPSLPGFSLSINP